MSKARDVSRLFSKTGSSSSDIGSSTVIYANFAAFPDSGNTAGDMAFATDTKAVYVWDGTEWDRVYTGSQTTPSFTTDPPSNLLLNTDGSNNVVTVAATDPQDSQSVMSSMGFLETAPTPSLPYHHK